MKKLVQISLNFMLLVSMLFTFQGCEKDSVNEINETSQNKNDILIKKLNFQDLKKIKELDNSLNLIQKKLDIHSKSEINADNGKLILLTNDIIQAVTDSISTYSFRLKTPTDSLSTFENFVITIEKDKVKYFLYRFRFNSKNSEYFPFDITFTMLDKNQIIEENFKDFNKYLYWTGHCLLDIFPLPYDGWGYQTIWCDEGGGGGTFYNGYGPSDSSTSGDSSTSTNTGSDSSDSSDENYNTGDVTSTGGGGSTGSSGDGDYIKPVGINWSYQENILNALYNSGYYSIQAEGWVLEYPIEAKRLANFLLANNNSPEAMSFANEVINLNINETDKDLANKLFNIVLLTKDQGYFTKSLDAQYLLSIDPYIDLDLTNTDIHDPIRTYFIVKYTVLKTLNPSWNETKLVWETLKDAIHTSLDIIGLVPLLGEPADLINGVLYVIEGDNFNAGFSFAATLPIVGAGSTATKYGLKIVNSAYDIQTKVKLVWKVTSNGIEFGQRSQLRKILNLGSISQDARQAHHIIPWDFANSSLVQKAAKSENAFHMNEALNGIPLPSANHLTGHNLYNDKVRDILIVLNNGNPSPNESYQTLISLNNYLRNLIQNNPNLNLGQIANLIKYP